MSRAKGKHTASADCNFSSVDNNSRSAFSMASISSLAESELHSTYFEIEL